MYNILGVAQQMEKLNSKKSPTRKKKKKKRSLCRLYFALIAATNCKLHVPV